MNRKAGAHTFEFPAEELECLVEELDTLNIDPNHTFRIGEDNPTLQDIDVEPAELPELAFVGITGGKIPEFERGESIATGGMGHIYLAKQLTLHRDVAIKSLREDKQTPEMNTRLMQEACLTGLLEHPNIIPIHQLGRDKQGNPLLVMKRAEGVSWSEVLQKRRNAPQKLSPKKRLLDWHIRILIQVCHAVEFAHSKGIIHRDLKPENVMLGSYGELYVLDWGIAVSVNKEHAGRIPLVEESRGILGTLSYMAPEMLVDDAKQVDKRTDVYLLGSILHELLTGNPPHLGDGYTSILMKIVRGEKRSYPDYVPYQLADICRRAMSQAKDARYQSVEDFREALQDFLTHRESMKLTKDASRLLKELKKHFTVVGPAANTLSAFYMPPEDISQEIYGLFSRCHFGLTQALRIWEDNEEAHQALQTLLGSMADYELNRKDYKAAKVLIDDLEHPDETLVLRLRDLQESQKKKVQQFRDLQRFEYELDEKVGAQARILTLFFLGLFFGVSAVVIHYLEANGVLRVTHNKFLLNNLTFTAFLSVSAYLGRKSLFRNKINRILLKSLFMISFVFVLSRPVYQQIGLTIHQSIQMDYVIFFTFYGMMGVFHNARCFISASFYIISFFFLLYLPFYQYIILGLTNFVGTLVVMSMWRVKKEIPEKTIQPIPFA